MSRGASPTRHVQHADQISPGTPDSATGASAVGCAQHHPIHPASSILLTIWHCARSLRGRASPSPTQAASITQYGVISVPSPRASEGHDSGRAEQPASAAWYTGPLGARLCDKLCFKNDFAAKREADWWESIAPGK